MSKKICIIDDDDDVRDIMKYALENEDIPTITFKNAKVALAGLTQMKPSDYPALIIVDFLMPEMNGIDFAETIQRGYDGNLAQIPMILSSANGRVEGIDRLPQAVKRIPKPIDLDELIKVVRSYLK